MFDYNAEKKKVEEAMQLVYREFALKYGEIQKSQLSEAEKSQQIDHILKVAITKEDILINKTSMSELSSEDKKYLEIKEESNPKQVDTNVIDTLVSIYAKRAKIPANKMNAGGILNVIKSGEKELEEIDTSAFEEELRRYFTEHYSDLLSEGYNYFLSEITQVATDDLVQEKNGELTQIAIKHNLDFKRFRSFGYQLTVQDGLVAQEELSLGESDVFYASPEAVNQRIFDLYSKTLFQEQKSKDKAFGYSDRRKLKNTYITYAQKNGIEIQNRDVLEELPIDMNKVIAIANYINRELNKSETTSTDLTEELIAEIQKDYSKIMNLTYFNFGELETVKRASNNRYISSLCLSINEDSIKRDDYSPAIAYGTPEYIKSEYQQVMGEITKLSHTDAFKEGEFDIERANTQKDALRRYITENGIEGIDISIPEAKIDHQRTELIADAILSLYGEKCEDKEGMKEKLLKNIEDKYSEMFYERQVIELEDLVGEELKEMGKTYVKGRLYMQKDFIYIGELSGVKAECLYATPEAILDKIAALDEKISTNAYPFKEKRIREELENYARDNKFEIEIPDVKSVEQTREQEQEQEQNLNSFRDRELNFFDLDMLQDDPTARPKIELEDTVSDVVIKISENLPGALVAISELMKLDDVGFFRLLSLDDMNIRGTQVWQIYNYLYNEDAKEFSEAIEKRDEKMVNFINERTASVGEEKAVTSGASVDRNKNPNKYRFTEEEVKQIETKKTERLEKEKEVKEKDTLMGKKSIGELDKELTELQAKEQKAKELCEQYEKQLPEKNVNEL